MNKKIIILLLTCDAIFSYGIEEFNQPNTQGGGFIAFGLIGMIIFGITALVWNTSSNRKS